MQARATRPRTSARGGWRPARSLSGRLIVGLVALLALGCATVGLVTYFAIQRALFNELDNQLQAATSVTNTCLDHWLDDDNNGGNGGNSAGQPAQGTPVSPLMTPYCEGLGTGTFLAYLHDGQWGGYVVPREITLSAGDVATLNAITPSQTQGSAGPPAPTYNRNLTSADSDQEAYSLTVVD